MCINDFLPIRIDRAGQKAGRSLANRRRFVLEQPLPPSRVDIESEDLLVLDGVQHRLEPIFAQEQRIEDIRSQYRAITFPASEQQLGHATTLQPAQTRQSRVLNSFSGL